jgi:solute carrier family 25 protein 33/36
VFAHSWAFGLSAASKLLDSALTYPHEVLRTRLREQNSSECAAAQSSSITAAHLARRYYRGIVHCTKTIIREEGFRGLYSGVGAHLVRVVPNSAIMFLVYEAVVNSSLWGNET